MMKRIFILIVAILAGSAAAAQVPELKPEVFDLLDLDTPIVVIAEEKGPDIDQCIIQSGDFALIGTGG